MVDVSPSDDVPATAPDPTPLPGPLEHQHRDISGGQARAAIFGVSDGLVSNVALILGVAGAEASQGPVRLAGVAGLLAGAFSMAAGEYVSMQAQRELLERELAMERREIERNPHVETVELALLYQSRGMDADASMKLATHLMSDPERALETHAREELGIDPNSLGSPIGAALSSFAAFCLGAIVPLIPWFFGGGNAAVIASVIIGIVGAAAVGSALAAFTGRGYLVSAARQVAVALLAAGVTFAVGTAVGASVG